MALFTVDTRIRYAQYAQVCRATNISWDGSDMIAWTAQFIQDDSKLLFVFP
jgi:hypothetical protein